MDASLQRLYAENENPVAFFDESYELRQGETFYILASALVCPEDLSNTRSALLAAYDNEPIHAAPMFQRMEYESLRQVIDISARQHDGMDVIVQSPVLPTDIRGHMARRRCLEYIVPLLHHEQSVSLFVMDSLESRQANRRDEFTFGDLRRSGVVGRSVTDHHAFPSKEPLLGLPDLLAWSFRQRLTRRDDSWFEPLRPDTEIHLLS